MEMSPKKLLVVEDDPGYCEFFETVLAPKYALTVCRSGEEALDRLEADRFDLVLCDVYLMGISGFEVLARARQGAPAVPVVMCSVHSAPEIREQALSAGAKGFIAKPFELEDFLKALESLAN